MTMMTTTVVMILKLNTKLYNNKVWITVRD